MKYEKIVKAKFIERENRFVARVEAGLDDDAETVKVHVKNTGRCRELLIPGSTVYLEDFEGRMGSRRMRYSLVAVEKKIVFPAEKSSDEQNGGMLLINMDSQAPNKVVQDALADGRIRLPGLSNLTLIKPEVKYGDSRFDFYVEADGADEQFTNKTVEPDRAFIEVKGVTLEDDGHARFPDAPTERGVKHINELIRARSEGYLAYVIFVVQMKGMKDVSPNYDTHPEFGEALAKAAEAGVSILAYDCKVTPDSLAIDSQIEFKL